MNPVTIPWKAWYGDEPCRLVFPQWWDVQLCSMDGAPGISDEEITDKLRNPINAHPLHSAATRAKSIAIAVDDLTRPTPAGRLLPIVLREFEDAGIDKSKIKIIIASGAHGALSKVDIERKLGGAIARNYRIAPHHPRENLADIGMHLDKIPVRINRDFFDADLKLSLGCITPHPFAGFSGGGKMVLPGLSAMEIIERTHRYVVMGFRGGMGIVEGNQFREEVEEVCRKCGLYMIVDVVITGLRQIAGVFAGHFRDAFLRGVELARKVYRTPLPDQADVAVINAYPKDTDLIQSENAFNVLRSTCRPFLNERGTVVLVTPASHGRGSHGLFEPGGRLYRKPIRKRWLGDRRLIVYSPGINRGDFHAIFWEGYAFCPTWDEVLTLLGNGHAAPLKVGVFPCASLQLGCVDDSV